MVRQIVAVSLMLALALPTDAAQKATPKEQVLSIPVGTVVVVKTKGKETLRGRLGEATDAGFAIQVVRQDKVETVQVPFTDLKSVKATEKASSGGVANAVAWGVVAGVGAAVGIILAVMFADH